MRAVFFGAESVLDHQRSLVREAFGFPPRAHYGLVEGVANISECPQGRLHVDEDFALVELLPLEDNPALCRIVGTSLWNEAMPFVRYFTGDIAAIGDDQTCSCGRAGRIVERIDGRQEDFLVRADGTRVACFNQVMKHASHVREAQIHQHQPGSITLRYVPTSGFDEREETLLRDAFRSRLGQDMQIRFQPVSSIARTPTGKIRFVISDIQQAKIMRPDPTRSD